MKYEAPEAMCMSVVLKENILNGLWTEVLPHFFLLSFISMRRHCTEMDEYLEAKITLH